MISYHLLYCTSSTCSVPCVWWFILSCFLDEKFIQTILQDWLMQIWVSSARCWTEGLRAPNVSWAHMNSFCTRSKGANFLWHFGLMSDGGMACSWVNEIYPERPICWSNSICSPFRLIIKWPEQQAVPTGQTRAPNTQLLEVYRNKGDSFHNYSNGLLLWVLWTWELMTWQDSEKRYLPQVNTQNEMNNNR